MPTDHCAVCGTGQHAHIHDQLKIVLCANEACVRQAFDDAYHDHLERVRPR